MPEIELLAESAKWRARNVSYMGGTWEIISEQIPDFALRNFGDEKVEGINPFYKTVIRLPRTMMEKEVPIGLVSQTYTLAPHRDVGQLCMDGFKRAGIDISKLKCELGLSELGEWMNLRVYFPDKYNFVPADREELKLRLECFNSVDGSSRLVIVLGWLRFVCSNGMIIGETMEQLRDLHDRHMDLNRIPSMIVSAMTKIKNEMARLERWGSAKVSEEQLKNWVDNNLATAWGKLAATRAYHICLTGRDVELVDRFEGGQPSDKCIRLLDAVPGSSSRVSNLYDISQVLAWLATRRNNAEQKVERQMQIPSLLEELIG